MPASMYQSGLSIGWIPVLTASAMIWIWGVSGFYVDAEGLYVVASGRTPQILPLQRLFGMIWDQTHMAITAKSCEGRLKNSST